MADEQLPHLRFDGFFISESFQNPKGGGSAFAYKSRIRADHGLFVEQQFRSAIGEFEDKAREDNEELYDEDIIYLEFESEPGYLLITDSFDNGYGHYRLSYSKLEKRLSEGEEKEVQKIGVFINKKGVSAFLKKVEAYLNENTKNNHPKNKPLLQNISAIRAATLECFWTEPIMGFPEEGKEVWWEVWIRRDDLTTDNNEDMEVSKLLLNSEIKVGSKRILFPEHIVILVKATSEQLTKTILYSDRLSELRGPKEIADFLIDEDLDDQGEWLEDFKFRINNESSKNSVLICLLDTGVNRGHPLLEQYLEDIDMHTVKPDWGKSDSINGGHGTQMAGNALYGDLKPWLVGQDRLTIYHKLESVKLINENEEHDEKLYGAVTIDAASQPVVINPKNKRIYCMAVTSDYIDHKGKPSSWSSSVDQIVFGNINEPNKTSIFLVSAGNVYIGHPRDYPDNNHKCAVEDPAQAFNALTIGAFTEYDQIDQGKHPNSNALANTGALSPFSRTGIEMERSWANKPDVVFEGGNLGYDRRGVIEPDSLKLLSTSPSFQNNLISTNWATSAATALGSRFSAELYNEYSYLWPETIRGLIIHSSEWTEAMTRGNNMASTQEKRKFLRTYGYGVPKLESAKFSATDRLTLVAEREIQPYQREGSNEPKINEYHLYELPWPEDALNSLFDETLRVNVTLSYFIEPNPGEKQYSKSYSYSSVGLRFKMCKPNESKAEFKARINKLTRDEDYQSESPEDWVLGPGVRDKGSVHRDWLNTTGPELATKKLIAVYPIGGWWKTRKKLKRYNETVRYSLIISIDAPENNINVDIYTPVKNQIEISIEV